MVPFESMRNYYVRPGRRLNFVFQMVHREELRDIFFDGAATYPGIAGYSVLVRDVSHEVGSVHNFTQWVITNPMNPSTKRILSINVRRIEKEEILVSTTEYWYLRWWDSKDNSYTYPYRETCRQQYVLRKHDGIWKVYEFIRPAPRTSVPHRRKYGR